APSWQGPSGQRRTSPLPGRGLLIERGTDARIRRSRVESWLIHKISKILWNSSTIVETKRILKKRTRSQESDWVDSSTRLRRLLRHAQFLPRSSTLCARSLRALFCQKEIHQVLGNTLEHL